MQIGCRGSGAVAILPALTCAYLDCFARMSDFFVSPRADYYITVNSFCGFSRVANDLFSFHNFVIDLDCHLVLDHHLRDYYTSHLLWCLENSLFSSTLMPPTSVVFTGRGLQLWWSIVGISVTYQHIYQEVLDFYLETIDSILVASPLDDLSMFHVDYAASKNPVGYFRLPGTINTRTNTLVSWEKYGGTYDLLDLYAKITPSPKQKALLPEKPKSLDIISFTSLAESRVSAFERLRNLRANDLGEEERNNFCFMVYNALVISFGHDYAYAAMARFNSSFLSPLSTSDLNNVISAAFKKGGYQYTTEKIIEFLHITPIEAVKIGLSQGESPYITKKERTKVLNHTKKDQRNKKILELYDQGKSMKYIAETLELSFPTVDKVLKDSNRKNKDERLKKILSLASQGKKKKEIASSCGCSVRTVQRVLDSS